MKNDLRENFNVQKDLSYLERKNIQADNYLLFSISQGTFKQFVSIGMESKKANIEESNSIGNVRFILETIYRVYLKKPNLHIDKLFENTLIEMLNGNFYDFYAAMDTIKFHLQYESTGKAPFKLKNDEMYKVLKSAILKNYEYIDHKMYYAGRNYENGLLGYVENLNNEVEKNTGHKIL